MNVSDLRQYRLIQQGIARIEDQTPLQVIKKLGAMQGQDYHGSLWAIGLRTGLTQREVIKSIEGHEIIRTWPQRGTLHFVPPEDSIWMVELSAERLIKGSVQRRVLLGLKETELLKAKEAAGILENGNLMTRPELLAHLEKEGISTASGRGYHILWYLAQTGVLFISAMSNKQPMYGLIDGSYFDSNFLTRAESITLLAKRYFLSHGPATVQDFAWWSGLTMKDARFGLTESAHLLRSELIDGTEYWLYKAAELPRTPVQSAYLLPGFDEYFLGYKDRSAIIDPAFVQQVVPGGNGMFKPTIVIDGKVVGTWQRVIKKDKVIITLNPFKKLSADDRKLLSVPIKQYSYFAELPIETKYPD